MASTSVKFSGDPQQLLQAYQQLYAANVKLQEQLANTARQSRRDRNAAVDHIMGEVRSVKSLAVSYLTVSSAVGAVSRAYDDWRQRIEGIAAKAREANQELVSTIVLSGQAANASEIARRLGSVPGMSGGQARAMFEGLTGGASNQVSHDRLLNLTASSAPLAALGIDLKTFGQFVGDLANHEPQSKPDALIARAMQIFSQPGAEKLVQAKMAGPIRKLVAAGMPQEEAWAFALEASNKGVPGLVGQLAGLVANPYEAPQTKGRTRLTPEEAGKARLAAAGSPEARRALLTSDRDVASAVGLDVAGLDLLDPAAIATSARELASGRGTPQDIASALAGTRAGAQVLSDHEVQLEAGLRAKRWGALARDRELMTQMFEGSIQNEGWASSAIARMAWQFTPWNDVTDPRLGNFGDLAAQFIELRNRETAAEGYQRFDPRTGALTEEAQRRDAESQAELTRQTKRLAEAMESLRGAPAPVTNLNER